LLGLIEFVFILPDLFLLLQLPELLLKLFFQLLKGSVKRFGHLSLLLLALRFDELFLQSYLFLDTFAVLVNQILLIPDHGFQLTHLFRQAFVLLL